MEDAEFTLERVNRGWGTESRLAVKDSKTGLYLNRTDLLEIRALIDAELALQEKEILEAAKELGIELK